MKRVQGRELNIPTNINLLPYQNFIVLLVFEVLNNMPKAMKKVIKDNMKLMLPKRLSIKILSSRFPN